LDTISICSKIEGSTSKDVTNFKEVIEMTNYREILRLKSLGINHSQIAEILPKSDE